MFPSWYSYHQRQIKKPGTTMSKCMQSIIYHEHISNVVFNTERGKIILGLKPPLMHCGWTCTNTRDQDKDGLVL